MSSQHPPVLPPLLILGLNPDSPPGFPLPPARSRSARSATAAAALRSRRRRQSEANIHVPAGGAPADPAGGVPVGWKGWKSWRGLSRIGGSVARPHGGGIGGC